MATNEDTLRLDRDSSEVSATLCQPCSEAGQIKEAIRYCVECQSYICQQCLEDHNKFPALRKHQIVDTAEAAKHLGETEQTKGDTQIECGSHYGQYIGSYCKDHNEVCCSVCVSVKHRSCKQIEKILKEAKGIKESKEIRDIKKSLEEFIGFVNQEKLDRKLNKINLDEEKKQILANIDKFEETLMDRIRMNAETSRDKIRASHAKHEKAVRSDVRELDTILSGLHKTLNKLKKTGSNDYEAFVSTKKCQKTLAEVKAVVNDLSDKWQQTELRYKFKDVFLFKDIKDLGDVIEESKTDYSCHLTCKGKVNIKLKTDTNRCKIKGICQLADGTFVIIDSNNVNLKRLTDNLEVTDTINLDDKPESICVTGPKEVAITLPEKSIVQFVKNEERLLLGSSFSTAPGRCTVINYDSGENKVYVCCTYVKYDDIYREKYSTISVYDKKGTLMTTFDKDSSGETVLSEPHQIFLGTDVVRVIDRNMEVLVLKKTDQGQLEYIIPKQTSYKSYSDNWFQRNGRCLFLLSEDIMLCSTDIGQMSLKTMEGRTTKALKMEKLSGKPAAFFNKQKSTLMVAGESCEIREYKMPLKILKLLK